MIVKIEIGRLIDQPIHFHVLLAFKNYRKLHWIWWRMYVTGRAVVVSKSIAGCCCCCSIYSRLEGRTESYWAKLLRLSSINRRNCHAIKRNSNTRNIILPTGNNNHHVSTVTTTSTTPVRLGKRSNKVIKDSRRGWIKLKLYYLEEFFLSSGYNPLNQNI